MVDAEPATMLAVVMTAFGAPEVALELQDVARPRPMPHNEVLIAVHAAGVNPFDTKLRRGWFQGMFPVAPPFVLGQDVAGVVAAKGFDVSEFEIGDRVWALLDPARPGGYAEYVATHSWLARRMPANLSFAEAASVPMAACTAWHALVRLAGVGEGARVLVHAGAGGVGGYAIQIAKAHGAWVAATTSAANLDYVRALGADLAIDYRAQDFTQAARDMDVVLDPVGQETNLKSYAVLKRGGTLLVILRGDQIEMSNRDRLMAEHGVATRVVAFSAAPELLDAMRPMFEDGRLKPLRLTTLPLDRAAEAHAMSETGRTVGKIVLDVRA